MTSGLDTLGAHDAGRQTPADLARVRRSGSPWLTRRGTATGSITLGALALVLATLSTAFAHHGSADYDVTREIRVTGTVSAWRWVNPHVRIVLSVPGKDGRPEEWDTEGPPLTWATQQKWSPAMFANGERLTLVMYPLKQQARGGLVKRIERASGDVVRVSRPWLDKD